MFVLQNTNIKGQHLEWEKMFVNPQAGGGGWRLGGKHIISSYISATKGKTENALEFE